MEIIKLKTKFLTNMTGVFVKGGKFGSKTETERGKMVWRFKGRRQSCNYSYASTSQGMLSVGDRQTPPARGGKKESALERPESMALPMTWFQTSGLQTPQTSIVSSRSVSGVFLHPPLETNTTANTMKSKKTIPINR